MAALTHWNPFKTMSRFEPVGNMDELFRNLNLRPLWRDAEIAPNVSIDVNEDDKVYRVKAEIPGADKNDIEISVEGNQVSISAEVKRETKRKDTEKELYTERYFGRLYRAFTLPNEVDSAKADAHYENGVLTLMLPKKGNGSARRIAVS